MAAPNVVQYCQSQEAPVVESNGISGSPTSLPTLCANALPWPPVCIVGGVATRGRPDAWP